MLSLKNVVKDYYVASETVHALKGVSINFRKSEFVSILGPSGCGKTTLLNIIGGLDRYTSGDLVINGKSTRFYQDRDWDVYRNHRIGFIFQSYNLIPHQTVLSNVELALTIAGVSKEERIRRSKEALDRVGLQDQYYKKPNQLSGGQCQRVAIARALVNDPEILLADEPTGALDTVTSVQIMDLIKEISKERLVIMVTHNPELADKYSSRIVRMLDGNLIEDTMPFSDEDEELEVLKEQEAIHEEKPAKKSKTKEKAKMSFFTAFKLSARNLITKKGRTAMVGFAGSIGIIGIALVLAFSAGIKGYVASMQDDMMSGNPITITESTYDLDALTGMMDMTQKKEVIKQPNRVYIDSMVEYFITMGKMSDNMLIKNNLTSDYVNYVKQMPDSYYSAMKLGYGIDIHNNFYTSVRETGKNVDTNISVTALTALYTEILKQSSFKEYTQYVSMFVPSMAQAPSSEEYIKSQYEIHGKVATKKNEIMLVINKESEASDLLLARLGYYTQNQFTELVNKAETEANGETYATNENYVEYFSYDELMQKTFYWYPNSLTFSKNGNAYGYEPYSQEEWKQNANAVELKVVGILQPKQSVSYGCLSSGVYYTEELTNHILAVSGTEEDGVVNYYKNLDVSSMSAMQLAMFGMINYKIDYVYGGKTNPSNQTLSLAGTSSMLSMMMGSNSQTSGDDLKNYVVRALGGNDIANSISIYPIDFDRKDLVTNYLDLWNGDETVNVNGNQLTKENRQEIKYTDTLSLIINLINTMIDVISYALIAFTSVSLVVSTVMIGIITYVSVVERVKEIGVIRSLGGRKKDVSYLFNAETFIIGLLAGIIGIGATYLISEVINLILFPLLGIRRIALLPISDAISMILLSVGLTLISGLIPSKSAAKKDPVIALRTE